MQLRAIIVDDEPSGIDALEILIKKHASEVRVVASAIETNHAITLIENYRPEVLFLDINMPGMSGFELLEQLTWTDFNLVFTTAHEEYALRALKKNAIDYLLKPVDPEDLKFAIQKIIQKPNSLSPELHLRHLYEEMLNGVQEKQKNKLLLNLRSGVEAIDLNDIVSLKSMANYTQIYLTNQKNVVASKNLKEFDIQLCLVNSNFMRVHNSFIINLTKVSKYLRAEETIIMVDGQKIPVARAKKESFHAWLSI